jgi:hypothetical protein
LSKQGHDQVVVIDLGDNNLRQKGLKSGFSVDDVIKSQEFKFELFFDYFLNFKQKSLKKKNSKTNNFFFLIFKLIFTI